MSWHFSQALVEDFLEANFSAGGRFAPLKENLIAYESLLHVSEMVRYHSFPSGKTSVPLTGRLGVALLTWFQAGSPASPSRQHLEAGPCAEDRWPDMLRVVGEVEPRFVFAENVARGPIDTAANDCRGRGFSTAMGMFCASGVGCPARRPRWWLVAYADGKGESRCPVDAEVAGIHPVAGLDWWQDDPRALGVVDGVADRMDRLAALGNGQVPSVAARAFTTLAKHLTKELAS